MKYENVYLVGTSLGGYYAIYLSEYYNIPSVIINPSITPYSTLKKDLGNMTNYYDNSLFEWKEEHLIQLKKYDISSLNSKNFLLLLQTGDEILDYKVAKEKFKNSKIIITEGGSHRFDNIEKYIPVINEFILNS